MVRMGGREQDSPGSNRLHYASRRSHRRTRNARFPSFDAYNFDPKDRTADAFATLRSVAAVSGFVDRPPSIRFAASQAQCGPMWAAEFHGFMQVWGTIPPLPAILANPNGAKIPSEPSSQYAVAMALAGAATPSNFDSVLTYMGRVGREFQHVTVTDALRRNPDVTDSAAYIRWAAANSDFTL